MTIEEKLQLLSKIFCIRLIDYATDIVINPYGELDNPFGGHNLAHEILAYKILDE